MNTSIEYRKTLIIMQIWWTFLLLEVGGFVFRLVAAKVIGQHMFFFILSYFFFQKLDSVMCIFLNMSIQNVLLEKMIIF